MKNKTAKTISVLMALLMITSTIFAITFNVQADTDQKCGDDLVWSIDYYGTLRISGVGEMDNYSYYGKTPWYQGRDNIKKVIIENGVTSIGDNAFYGCENLVYVVIPPSVTTIGEYAFCDCYALESVTIPSQVTQIGKYAFGYYLYTVLIGGTEIDYDEIIGESLINAWDRYVTEERKIDGFKIFCYLNSEGARYAAENGIDYEITIDYESGECGDDLVWALDDYGTLTISGVGAMNDYSDYEKIPWYESRYRITKVIIENGVTSISANAFYECENLLNVIIPPSVTTIGEYAFFTCYTLKNVTIPSQVTQIGKYAFGYYLYEEVWVTTGTQCDCTHLDESHNNEGFIYITEERKIDGFKIFCYLNSEGARYASDNNIDYEYISSETHKKGDVNSDSEIDSADATTVLKYDAGTLDISEDQLKIADINGDGAVDSADATMILKYDAGMIDKI